MIVIFFILGKKDKFILELFFYSTYNLIVLIIKIPSKGHKDLGHSIETGCQLHGKKRPSTDYYVQAAQHLTLLDACLRKVNVCIL